MKAIGGLLPLITFLLIQVIVVARGDGRASLSDGAVANPAEVKVYWGVTLPNTPMPPAMLDILAPPQGDISKVNAEYKRATQDEKAQGSEKFPRKFGHKLLYKKGDDKKLGKASFYNNQVGKASFYNNQVPNKVGDDQNIDKIPFFYNQVPNNKGDDQKIGKITFFYNQVTNNYKDDQKISKVTLFYNQVLTNDKDDQKIVKVTLFYNQVLNNNGGDEEIGEGRKHIHRHEHAHVHLPKAMRDVFFFKDDLVTGSALTTRIPSTITNLDFLHQDASKHLPFSSKNFTDIINMFGPASLTMADDIAWTLKQCDHPEMVHGEIAECATSIESFVELVVSSLGTNNVRAFSSGAPNEGVASVNYTLASVNLLTNSQSVLVCHDMPYPYKVFYCHTAAPSRAYQLKLVSDVGLPSMDALAVCHLNTSTWDPEHPFFQVMHVKPGQTTACHFLNRGSIVWVPIAELGDRPVAAQ